MMGYDGFQHHAMFGLGDGGWWWPMGLHGIFSLLWIGVIALVIYWIVRAVSGRSTNDPALSVLGQQYAAGELSRDEYLQKRKDLQV